MIRHRFARMGMHAVLELEDDTRTPEMLIVYMLEHSKWLAGVSWSYEGIEPPAPTPRQWTLSGRNVERRGISRHKWWGPSHPSYKPLPRRYNSPGLPLWGPGHPDYDEMGQ